MTESLRFRVLSDAPREQVSYEVGGDVLSIAELEHAVLRGACARPAPAWLRALLPAHAPAPAPAAAVGGGAAAPRAAGLAPLARDWRLNFALSCGARSCARAVAALAPETVDAQLDAACVAYFAERCHGGGYGGAARVAVDADRRGAVVLPRVMSWCAHRGVPVSLDEASNARDPPLFAGTRATLGAAAARRASSCARRSRACAAPRATRSPSASRAARRWSCASRRSTTGASC